MAGQQRRSSLHYTQMAERVILLLSPPHIPFSFPALPSPTSQYIILFSLMANELRRAGAYRSGEVVLVLTHGVIARALTGNTVCHAVCYHQVARFYKGFGVALISVRHRKHAPTHAHPHARPHGLRAPFVPIHLLRSSALSGLNSLCVRASVRRCVCASVIQLQSSGFILATVHISLHLTLIPTRGSHCRTPFAVSLYLEV